MFYFIFFQVVGWLWLLFSFFDDILKSSLTLSLEKRLLMKKHIGRLGGVLRVDKILLWIRSGNLEREENLQMKMEDLKQYKCLLSDSGNGDEEVFYILNFEPSGIRFPRQAAITLPQLPGKGNLFIFHGTADLDGFIEWEDYTSKVEILRIGNVDCLSLGLTSFCKYAIGVSTKRYVKRTLLDRFNNRYYARATTLFQRLNCLPLSFDCCVLFESEKVHAEDSKTSEANVLTKKNSYSRCEVGQVAKIYARKPLIITCDVSGTHFETIEHIVDSSKLCEIGDVVSFKEIGKEAPVSGRFTIKQHQNRQEKTLWSLRFWEVSKCAILFFTCNYAYRIFCNCIYT